MNPERLKYSKLFSIVTIVVAVFLMSFSSRLTTSGIPGILPVSISTSIRTNYSEVYEPEFKLKADSVIIPMKRAGRLFLIDATVDGETGNLDALSEAFGTTVDGMLGDSFLEH